MEDIAKRPREVLVEVFGLLGASTHVDWSSLPYSEKRGAGPGAPLPPRYRDFRHDLYSHEIEAMYQRFGTVVEELRASLERSEEAGQTASKDGTIGITHGD